MLCRNIPQAVHIPVHVHFNELKLLFIHEVTQACVDLLLFFIFEWLVCFWLVATQPTNRQKISKFCEKLRK